MLPFERPSFTKGLAELKGFLESDPSRIDMYGQRPFGILIYRPSEEFLLRAALRTLQTELTPEDHRLKVVSFADLAEGVMEQSLKSQGAEWKDLYDLETDYGMRDLGQGLVDMLDQERALASAIAEQARELRPKRDALILTRAGFLYPHYRVNPLLEALGNFSDMRVATILCYPGVREGETGLSFMGYQEVLRGYRQRLF
jgi:hypothetical protein